MQSTQPEQQQTAESPATPAGVEAIAGDGARAEQSQALDAGANADTQAIIASAGSAEPAVALHGQGSRARRAWLYDVYLAGLIVLAFVADQTSKGWIRSHLLLGESLPTTGFIRLMHTYNTGSAFGLFPGQTFLLMLASLVGIGILLLYFKNETIPPFWLRTSLGMLLGGAAGNLVDRITLGHVTDFVAVGTFPVFNVADSSIMTGIAILAWFVWRTPREPAKRQKASVSPTETPSAGEQPAAMDVSSVAAAAPNEGSLAVASVTSDTPQPLAGEDHARKL